MRGKEMRKYFAVACLVGVLTSCALADSDKAKLDGRLVDAARVIRALETVPDQGIPDKITESATCVAVIPGLKKGAFIFGVTYGQGVVTCRTGHGWSAPAFIRISGGNWGLQLGGESTDLVLVATNEQGMQDLLKSKIKLGADAAAAIGPVGRNTQAATDLKLGAELLTWSRSRGAFAGISLDGSVVDQNGDDTRTFYGADEPFGVILKGNQAVPGGAARDFVSAVSKYFRSVQ
jgi:lipid-binding SYLF domain-containing protein